MKIKHEELRFGNTGRVPNCPGTYMFVATYFASPCPVCTIWYRHVHMHTEDILDIYTDSDFRRQGLALKTILEWIRWHGDQTVYSTAKTNDESKGLMLKAGFRQERDGWFRRPQYEEPCPSI